MKVVAFDAKPFRRSSTRRNHDRSGKAPTAFVSQLGIGVTIPEPAKFAERYIDASQELMEKYNMDYSTPFVSSASLRDYLNVIEMKNFARDLVWEMQDHIESVHCSFVMLSPAHMPYVETGGIKCPVESVPTDKFIEQLAPSFSYITAQGYLWAHRKDTLDDAEMHIDAFSSKHTMAWNNVREAAPVSVYYKGDECNPFISCADMLAFYVDNELAIQWMKLHDETIRSILEEYSFGVTVRFFDKTNMPYIVWKMNQTVNFANLLKRPIVFLALDRLDESKLDRDEPASSGPSPAREIRQTEVYQAALTHAYQKGGCMKIFNPREDRALVKSGDVFIYAGSSSRDMGRTLGDMADIEVVSGREAIRSVRKFEKSHTY